MNLGTPGLLIVLLVIGLIVLAWAVPIWAIVHAAGTPDTAWSAVGSSRVMWITLIVVGMFLSPSVSSWRSSTSRASAPSSIRPR